MGSSKLKLDFLDPPTQDGDLGTLGHYRIIDQLGKGGMGYVFRAEDTKLKRSVALKVMNRKIAATPHSRARFISEARAMAAVHHDNVATIFEVGEKNKTPFMAMEMLKGSTLERFKGAEQRPSYQEIIQFARDIARGLAAAHAQGIVHRDIKPANIWVEEENDRIKILDFGLALASTPVDQLAGRGAVIGTPGYLSPEQARSEPLDDRSDLYSVGVVLYELATGVLPLHNKSVAGQLIAILAHKPTPLRELNPNIPQPLADLIHRLLRKEPRNRISSAAELEKQLDVAAVDCESKSEVAQALNKLQMGLDQITKQKDEPDFASPMMLPDLPDPFATLPESPASGSGSFPAVPAAAAPAKSPAKSPAKQNTHRKQSSKKKPTASQEPSAIKKYWPIGAAVAVALIAIPAGLIAFSGPDKPKIVDAPIASVDSQDKNDTPKTNQYTPPKQQSPTPQNNSGNSNQGGSGSPTLVKTIEIDNAYVAGATPLINKDKRNGSFEQSGAKLRSGKNGAKSRIPHWAAVFKGKQAGFAKEEKRAATDGDSYAFIDKSSSIELTADTIGYHTQPGDVFRLVFDVASISGDGNWKGKTKYVAILILKEKKQGSAKNKWKLGEIQDQTDISSKTRTIGFQYTATEQDTGLMPSVKINMTEGNGRRSKSYLDNVRFTVESKSNSMAATQPDLSQMAVNSTPIVTQPSEMVSQGSPNPITPDSVPPTDSDPQPQPTEPVAQMATTTIHTTEGIGVDSTVKKGGSTRDQLGTRPLVSIQMRGKVEVQHAYMRFDLSTISSDNKNRNQNRNNNQKNVSRKTGKAALVLHFSDTKNVAGGTIRLYGTSTPESQRWGEKGNVAINWKNSYSNAGLSTLPLLAELEIPQDHRGRIIKISSTELADLVRTAAEKSVTLIVAGGSSGMAPLNFVSREGKKDESPALIVEVATDE